MKAAHCEYCSAVQPTCQMPIVQNLITPPDNGISIPSGSEPVQPDRTDNVFDDDGDYDGEKHTIIHRDRSRRWLLIKRLHHLVMDYRYSGFQNYVKLIATATADQLVAALQSSAGQPGDVRDAHMEALSNNHKAAEERRSTIKQLMINTKDVPLTDSYRRMRSYSTRKQNSAEQPVNNQLLPVASPSVMFWRVQKDGFKPWLQSLTRHMLESATFHLTYSVTASCPLERNHLEPIRAVDHCDAGDDEKINEKIFSAERPDDYCSLYATKAAMEFPFADERDYVLVMPVDGDGSVVQGGTQTMEFQTQKFVFDDESDYDVDLRPLLCISMVEEVLNAGWTEEGLSAEERSESKIDSDSDVPEDSSDKWLDHCYTICSSKQQAPQEFVFDDGSDYDVDLRPILSLNMVEEELGPGDAVSDDEQC